MVVAAGSWEGGIREPAAVRWKGTIPPGRTTDALAATYDIFATILALSKAPAPDVILDGKDLTKVLMGCVPRAAFCRFVHLFLHFSAKLVFIRLFSTVQVRYRSHAAQWGNDFCARFQT